MRKKTASSDQDIVTFVENPSGSMIAEISEAQDNPDELTLDEDWGETDEDMEASSAQSPIEDSADLEVQLDRLAKVISQQEEPLVLSGVDSAVCLEKQIAEDQALEAEALSQEEDESSPALLSNLDQDEIQSCIEALLFISDKPLSLARLKDLLGPDLDSSYFQAALENIQSRYQGVHHGFELIEVAGGYQFRTKAGRADLAKKLVRTQTQRLSTGGMETLAIIAYKQPIMKEEVDKIRGVDSSYFIRGLIDKKLIKISGRSELPGRPILYSTTPEFLELFGLKDLAALPSLREIEQMIPASQSSQEDEDPRVKEMRRLVGEMKADQSSALYYNPKEDEKILKEIRERVSSIPVSTPFLDEMKAAELLAAQQEALKAQGLAVPEPTVDLATTLAGNPSATDSPAPSPAPES